MSAKRFTFPLPDLGEGLQEAELVEWQVAPGDAVEAGQPLAIVETDKAQVEVTAPASATVVRLMAEPGAVVAVGAPLVELEGEEPAASHSPPAAAPRADAGTVVGVLPSSTEPGPHSSGPGVGPTRVVPAARALARRRGIDPARISGTGPEGAVTVADVERSGGVAEGYEPLRGVRFAMARNMARAHRLAVPATVTGEADVDDWRDAAQPILRLLRAVGMAAAVEPALNAWLDAEGRARRLHQEVHCGVAVDSAEGLFVPVLRDVRHKDALTLGAELAELAAAVETRRVTREALQGATITLSNFGSFGGRFAQLVVLPPQVAIVGAGRIEPRVVARDGAPAVRRILPLSVSFDHRAVSGGEATRFLQALVADLERPE